MKEQKNIKNQTSNELLICKNVAKENNPNLFDRIKSFETIEQYLDYVMDLDLTLNGTGQIVCGYETAEACIKNSQTLSRDKLIDEVQNILNEVTSNIESIIDLEPNNVRMSGLDEATGLMFIPEDNVIQYVKLQLDKLVGLVNILKEKK